MLQILQKEPGVTAYVSRTFDGSRVIVERGKVYINQQDTKAGERTGGSASANFVEDFPTYSGRQERTTEADEPHAGDAGGAKKNANLFFAPPASPA